MTIDNRWKASGLCKTTKKLDPITQELVPYTLEDFFPGPDGAKVPHEVRTLCKKCPVKEQCLNHALTYEKYGYWGGTSERQRRIMRRARNIKLIHL